MVDLLHPGRSHTVESDDFMGIQSRHFALLDGRYTAFGRVVSGMAVADVSAQAGTPVRASNE
jgi:cyclophilin family peptidyl-prolyl cis-trans isomerase